MELQVAHHTDLQVVVAELAVQDQMDQIFVDPARRATEWALTSRTRSEVAFAISPVHWEFRTLSSNGQISRAHISPTLGEQPSQRGASESRPVTSVLQRF